MTRLAARTTATRWRVSAQRVSIVTTDGRAGRAGFTASAACSVTDDPPTLLVCLNRTSSAYVSVSVIQNSVVCVNVLSARHERLLRLFGGKVSVQERFAAAVWSTLETGAPVLADCAGCIRLPYRQCHHRGHT
jgi:flavin reductase